MRRPGRPRGLPMLGVGLSCLLLLPAQSPPHPRPLPQGAPVADFTLRDTRGATFRLDEFRDRAAVVVPFLGLDCPLAKLYGPRLAELARTYGPRGVAFLGVNANHLDSATAVAADAREHGLPFPVLKDVNNDVADKFG